MSISVPINSIRIDGGTQIRVGALDEEVVAEYAESIESLPPVDVFVDDTGVRWLADGFYRYAAHKLAGKASIQANQHRGSQRYALLHAVKANHQHGKRRSREDKRNAVLTMINDPEWSKWSDTKIAQACAVSQPFVSKLRSDIRLGEIKKEDAEARGKSNGAAPITHNVMGAKPAAASKTQVSDEDDDLGLVDPPAAATTAQAAPEPTPVERFNAGIDEIVGLLNQAAGAMRRVFEMKGDEITNRYACHSFNSLTTVSDVNRMRRIIEGGRIAEERAGGALVSENDLFRQGGKKKSA